MFVFSRVCPIRLCFCKLISFPKSNPIHNTKKGRNIITLFGSETDIKSTLYTHLFQTHFDIMAEVIIISIVFASSRQNIETKTRMKVNGTRYIPNNPPSKQYIPSYNRHQIQKIYNNRYQSPFIL